MPLVEETLEGLSLQATIGGGWADTMPESRLSLAALHDLISDYARRRERLARQRIEARYQGNRTYRWFAFLGMAFPLLLMLGLAVWKAWPSLLLTMRVYVLLQVHLARGAERWQAPLISVGVSYGVVAAIASVATAYDAMIRRNTESDTYLREHLTQALGHWLRRWTRTVCAFVAFTVLLNLASTALTTILTAH